MENIFSKHIFPKLKQEELYKPQMEGFSDPSMAEFQLLDFSCMMLPEFKDEKFELEYIKSFLNAADKLATVGQNDTARPGAYIFFEHSYAIPVLFLSRHCIELTIKRAIRRSGGKVKDVHNLVNLWNSFLSCCPNQKQREDRRVLKQMGDFVRMINSLDSSGTKLRYSSDKDGLTQDRPLWVNSTKIASCLKLFVEQLESLDLSE